jgi:hypothetical protein
MQITNILSNLRDTADDLVRPKGSRMARVDFLSENPLSESIQSSLKWRSDVTISGRPKNDRENLTARAETQVLEKGERQRRSGK